MNAKEIQDRVERKESAEATLKVWVTCAGCSRVFRGFGIICARCKFKPITVIKER